MITSAPPSPDAPRKAARPTPKLLAISTAQCAAWRSEASSWEYEPKSKRIAAILNLWEKIKGSLVVPADPLEVAEYNKLTLALQSMELPAPVAPPPPPRAYRRELPKNRSEERRVGKECSTGV